MSELASKIVAALRYAIGTQSEQVLLHRPYLPSAASEYVRECIDTGWVSSAGSYVSRFETELAEYTGCGRAVATVNGTAALEMCFRLAGVQREDEVICPSLTFVATANAVSHCDAMPHFVDVSPNRLSICPQALADRLDEIVVAGRNGPVNRETGRRIAAVCLMHCLGHPGDIDGILDICRRFEIPLVEDAAESLGSYYKGHHTGKFGLLSAVSFNGNKILTTGGGGVVLTDDEALASRAKHLTTTAKIPHAWEFEHDEVAWNFRMPNLNAAIGVAQLEILPQMIRAKRQLAGLYADSFRDIPEVSFIHEPSDSVSNYWLNGFVLNRSVCAERDNILRALNSAGLQSRPLWRPMHHLPMYAHCPRGPLDTTESLCARVINIPSSAELSPEWSAL